MRKWWKRLGLLAGGLVSLGGLVSSAAAQYPPPGGGYGPPPGMGMGGPPPGGGYGPPPGMGMGGPPPGAFASGPAYGVPPDFPNAAPPPKDPASPFSVKDEGMPNAFGWDHPPYEAYRFQMSAGYTFLWFKAGNLPATATTGSINDPIPGAIGQPNTVVLATGARDPGLSSAFRTTMTYWIVDPEIFCIDGNFFIMEQRSLLTNFNSDGNGNPVLARPFFNPVANANDADPRALPFVQRGTMSDAMRTRLMGAEANLKWFGSPPADGLSYNFLAGFRWLSLQERYNSYDNTVDLGGGGFNTTISDTFATYNQYFGAQIGSELTLTRGRFTAGLGGKIAVGPNNETVKILGQTSQTDQIAGTTVVANNQGLFAQPSNVGTYNHTIISVLPEANFRIAISLTDRIRFNTSYSFTYLSNVARPGDQMNRTINPQPLGTGPLLAPALPGPLNIQQSNFNMQMINLSLEFVF